MKQKRDQKLPAKGEEFGDQVVLYRIPVERYPEGHKLAGQKLPPRMRMLCNCGTEWTVSVRALRDGSHCCLGCSQKRRLEKVRKPVGDEQPRTTRQATEFILAMRRAANGVMA